MYTCVHRSCENKKDTIPSLCMCLSLPHIILIFFCVSSVSAPFFSLLWLYFHGTHKTQEIPRDELWSQHNTNTQLHNSLWYVILLAKPQCYRMKLWGKREENMAENKKSKSSGLLWTKVRWNFWRPIFWYQACTAPCNLFYPQSESIFFRDARNIYHNSFTHTQKSARLPVSQTNHS